MSVSGKAALVTGGAQGLGKGFSRILLQKGAKVLFTDVNESLGQATLKDFQREFGENNALFIKADVTSKAEMEESFQLAKTTFGRLDIVVNNAGVGGETDDKWAMCVDINLKGPILCSRLALHHMRREQGGQGGVIVNISSMGGLKPQPFAPVYSANKAGLIMYTRSMAVSPECRGNNIRVNALCPSFADTQLLSNVASDLNETVGQQVKAFVQQTGVMTVDYVAEGFFDLVSDDSKNGAVMTISKAEGKVFVPY